jgi:hypothetical protein
MPAHVKAMLIVALVIWLALHWPDDNFPDDGAAA